MPFRSIIMIGCMVWKDVSGRNEENQKNEWTRNRSLRVTIKLNVLHVRQIANRRVPNSMHLSDIINCKMRKIFIVVFKSIDIEIVSHLHKIKYIHPDQSGKYYGQSKRRYLCKCIENINVHLTQQAKNRQKLSKCFSTWISNRNWIEHSTKCRNQEYQWTESERLNLNCWTLHKFWVLNAGIENSHLTSRIFLRAVQHKGGSL